MLFICAVVAIRTTLPRLQVINVKDLAPRCIEWVTAIDCVMPDDIWETEAMRAGLSTIGPSMVDEHVG